MPRIERNNGLDYLEYRTGSGGTVEIFDIAVTTQRERGIGRSMVQELKATVQTNVIYAFTREENHVAQAFYKALGFRQLAFLSKFYPEGNAILYALYL